MVDSLYTTIKWNCGVAIKNHIIDNNKLKLCIENSPEYISEDILKDLCKSRFSILQNIT